MHIQLYRSNEQFQNIFVQSQNQSKSFRIRSVLLKSSKTLSSIKSSFKIITLNYQEEKYFRFNYHQKMRKANESQTPPLSGKASTTIEGTPTKYFLFIYPAVVRQVFSAHRGAVDRSYASHIYQRRDGAPRRSSGSIAAADLLAELVGESRLPHPLHASGSSSASPGTSLRRASSGSRCSWSTD